MPIPFDNSYARLPESMFTQLSPTPVANPEIIKVNTDLAASLGISEADLTAEVLSGNQVPEGASPLAQLYAGHQFGNWNPQLGDGRAILLGEVNGFDIQLKGSGRTPYSRGGDGRSWLGPVLREYLLSEAMHAMGVPTTRALAAVTTGEEVYRETPLPGAIFTRVASSHIRVGTFQIYAARGMKDELQALCDHAIARHYPDAKGPEDLLNAVIAAQAKLISKWMGLGFIHGVMNTDNCAISGETIDYGPAAYLDVYDPDKVFSSIDQTGRYAFNNQPRIAIWNLAQLATALIPLMPDEKEAIEVFTQSVNQFPDIYQAEWLETFGAKLGLTSAQETDVDLIQSLLTLMAQSGSDFTQTFAALGTEKARDHFIDRDAFDEWEKGWLARNPDDALMKTANPRVIPRNHKVEETIAAGVEGDFAPFHKMLAAVTDPYQKNEEYERAPSKEEEVTRTFCGT